MGRSQMLFRAALEQVGDSKARFRDRLTLRKVWSSDALSDVLYAMVEEELPEEDKAKLGAIGDGTILDGLKQMMELVLQNLELIINLAIKLMQAIKDIFLS